MSKKAPDETPTAQVERFRQEVQKLIDAGELSPEEAEAALDRVVRHQKR